MAHHGKEGVVKVAGNVAANVTGFTLETSADVVEISALTNSAKTFTAVNILNLEKNLNLK